MASSLRLSRFRALPGMLRKFGVKLDAELVAKIGDGDSFTLPVEPGPHTLQVQTSWCGSPIVDFTVEDGESIKFDCGYNDWPWSIKAPGRFLRFWFRPYYAPLTFLVLRRIGERSP